MIKFSSIIALLLSTFLVTKSLYALDSKIIIKGPDIITGKELRFELETAQDKMPKDKGIVIVFLSARCPCSDSHVEEMEDLKKIYTDFKFVGVHSNADEDLKLSKEYFERRKLPFTVIQDQNMEIADQFKAFKTPHVFVVSPEGKILYQGGVTNSAKLSQASKKFLRDALEDIHNGRAVRVSEGRTLGCVIGRSR